MEIYFHVFKYISKNKLNNSTLHESYNTFATNYLLSSTNNNRYPTSARFRLMKNKINQSILFAI